MAYSIVWHEDALNDLKKINKPTRGKIFDRVTDYLSKDPEKIGKPLKGNFSGMWRYRYGDYRIIYVIDENENTIRVLEVGHRREVYKHK